MRWMEVAEAQVGTDEDKRPNRSNPEIMQWAKDIGGWITSFYKGDDIPWCGLFVGWVMKASGYPITIKNPLGALEWLNYGTKTAPRFGAIMCFKREGGGHVGFYVSEDAEYFHILGGNQSDTVNVTKISKARFAGAVWPPGDDTDTQRILKEFDGQVTTNEA